MTEILLVGDIHFKIQNEDQCEQLVAQIIEMVDDKNIRDIIFLGDLMHYHEKISLHVQNRILDFFTKLERKNVRSVVLVGNHDMINNQVFCDPSGHWLNVFQSWSSITVVDVPMNLTIKGIKFAAFPYVFAGRFKEAAEKFNVDIDKADFCLAHQEFRGAQMGAITSTHGDEYVWETPCVSGHIHSYQTLNNNTIIYTGSAFEHTFGSSKCWLFLLDHRTKSLTKIPSKVASKSILHATLSSVTSIEISKQSKHLNKLILEIKNVEDYKRWIQSEQGILFSKHYTLEYRIIETNTTSNGDIDSTRKNLNVVDVFRNAINLHHPDCIPVMNKLLNFLK